MPTRQREYRTRRSLRAPHLEQYALSDGSSAPHEVQRRIDSLRAPHMEQYALSDGSSAPHEVQRRIDSLRAPHMEQYALSDGISTPQEAQRIDSFSLSAGCSLDIREYCTICSPTCAAFLLRVWGRPDRRASDAGGFPPSRE